MIGNELQCATNKPYTENLNEPGREGWCICFHGYVNEKGYTVGRGRPPGEEKPEQS